jgi:hypothetical protein
MSAEQRARLDAALKRQRAKEVRAKKRTENVHLSREQRLLKRMEMSKKKSEDRFYSDAYHAIGRAIAAQLCIRCTNIEIRKVCV